MKQEFYRTDATNQYESCLYWLRRCPIFKATEGFYLLQMIFNVDRRVFRLGEALVRAGETPDGMFIVTAGQCKAVLEQVALKKLETGEYSRFEKQPKGFVCGVPRGSQPASPKGNALRHKEESLARFNPENSFVNTLKGDPRKTYQSARVYIDDNGRHMAK